MASKIYIFINHEAAADKVMGEFENGVVTLKHPIPSDFIFQVFGNCGYRMLEAERREDLVYVKKFEILEWSFPI